MSDHTKTVAIPAEISWEGDSLSVLKKFPDAVKMEFGVALRKLQTGEFPDNVATRPMPSVGKRVFELKESDEKTWYRVMYLSKMDNVIYVLHSFEKDSAKTDKRDLNTATKRLSRVLKRIQEQKKVTKKAGKGNG